MAQDTESKAAALPGMMAVPAEALKEYRALHDGLSDMVESGRVGRRELPEDYLWLVEKLERLAVLDPDGTDTPEVQ